MHREFTASAYILHENKLLLLWHKKLQKWLPPGGHLEKDETPIEAVKREVLEETGLYIDILLQENLHIKEHNAISIPRPYLCLLEKIPAFREVPPHEHIDFIFLATPKNALEMHSPESTTLRWFSLEELLVLEEEVFFQETKDTAKHILETFSSHPSLHL